MGILDADIKVETIFDIPLELLKEKEIDSLIIDVDNTITEWRGREVDDSSREWFLKLESHGFKACLVSNNNSGERIGYIAKNLGIPHIHKAGKPFKFAFRKAMAILDSSAEKTAVVGDQIFTDVLGGNCMGMITILVDPISQSEFLGTKVMRLFEKVILKRSY